jgi:hypothetical protein
MFTPQRRPTQSHTTSEAASHAAAQHESLAIHQRRAIFLLHELALYNWSVEYPRWSNDELVARHLLAIIANAEHPLTRREIASRTHFSNCAITGALGVLLHHDFLTQSTPEPADGEPVLSLTPARPGRVRTPLELATVLVGLHPAKFPGSPHGPDCRAHKTMAPDFLQGHDAQLEDLRELHLLHSLPAANRHHNAASLCRRTGSRRLGLHPKTLYHPDPFSQVIVFSHQSLKSDPHGGRRVSCDYAQR